MNRYKRQWTADAGDSNTRASVVGADNRPVAAMLGEQDIRDAFLVAAAPDLLEALELVISYCQAHQDTTHEVFRKAEAAIRKSCL